MQDPKKVTSSKTLVMALLSVVGGVVGMWAGRSVAVSMQTTPAWLGPAMLVGSIALLLIGLLMLPAVIRSLRKNKQGSLG